MAPEYQYCPLVNVPDGTDMVKVMEIGLFVYATVWFCSTWLAPEMEMVVVGGVLADAKDAISTGETRMNKITKSDRCFCGLSLNIKITYNRPIIS